MATQTGTPATAGKGTYARYPVLDFTKLLANGAGGTAPPGGTDGASVDHNAVRAVVGKMPPPSPLRQAQTLVSGELAPLETAVTSGYTGMANAGSAAIKQATDAYANELAAEHGQLTQPYTQAEAGAAASQDAFANRLTGAGTSAADELAQRLGSIGEPGAVNPVVAGLAGKATDAGNAVYGTGNATLDQLLSEGAAAEGYASKLPGVARTAGLQQLGQFEGQLGANESKDLLALEEKAPGLVSSAYGTLTSAAGKAQTNKIAQERVDATDKQNQIKQIVATNIDPATGRLTPEGVAQLKQLGVTSTGVAGSAGASVVRANNQTVEFNTKQSAPNPALSGKYGYLVDAKGNAVGGKITPIAGYKVNAAGDGVVKVATVKPDKLSTSASGKYGYQVDTSGKPILDSSGGKIPYPKSGSTSGSLSENDVGKMLTEWHDGKVQNVRVAATHPDGSLVTNSSGAPVYVTKSGLTGKQTYQQAISRLMGLGKSRGDAEAAANSVYAPGDQGRPWLTGDQEKVLSRTGAAVGKPGRGANVATINGHAVLDPSQYQALKHAGKLPAGQLSAEGFYVIA